jgi:hypothetical protein
METYFQLAPAALPALAAGDTKMTFELGDRSEMIEWTIPTWESEKAVAGAAWKLNNARWTGQWTAAIEPADQRREGSVIFEIKAPPGKVLTRLTADVGGSMNNTGEHVPEDRIDVFGAAGRPADFKLLGSAQAPPYGEHWTRRVPVSMDFPPEHGGRSEAGLSEGPNVPEGPGGAVGPPDPILFRGREIQPPFAGPADHNARLA